MAVSSSELVSGPLDLCSASLSESAEGRLRRGASSSESDIAKVVRSTMPEGGEGGGPRRRLPREFIARVANLVKAEGPPSSFLRFLEVICKSGQKRLRLTCFGVLYGQKQRGQREEFVS